MRLQYLLVQIIGSFLFLMLLRGECPQMREFLDRLLADFRDMMIICWVGMFEWEDEGGPSEFSSQSER